MPGVGPPVLVNIPSRVFVPAQTLPVNQTSLTLLTNLATVAQRDLDAVIHVKDVLQGQLTYVNGVIASLEAAL